MKLEMTSPCGSCPFKKDVNLCLTKKRAREIVSGIVDQDKTFKCHKTIGLAEDKAQHCAGALIMLEKIERPNQLMRIYERIGCYDRSKLNMKAEVFDSFKDFISAQRG